MRALGLDVGAKTIGVARSDEAGIIATAWQVIARRGHEPDLTAVAQLVVDSAAQALVVGLPLELDGRVGRRARSVLHFADGLQQALPALIHVQWDERFSTAAAERTLLEADMSRSKRKKYIDAAAAQFILQGWLDARVNGKME